jgi:hypothetical protein
MLALWPAVVTERFDPRHLTDTRPDRPFIGLRLLGLEPSRGVSSELWLIASVTFCVIPVAAALAALLIRRGIGFERLVLSNEVAGYQYSTLGVMCAVLLALAIVAVWADFREA